MTPAQKAALEALAGRELTAGDEATLDPWLEWDVRNDAAVATHLSQGHTAVRSRVLTDIAMTEALMAADATGGYGRAKSVLGKLKALANADDVIEAARNRLRGDGLDFGNGAVRAQIAAIGQLPVGGFSQDEVGALMALAVVPAPLTTAEVSDALNKAEGRMALG